MAERASSRHFLDEPALLVVKPIADPTRRISSEGPVTKTYRLSSAIADQICTVLSAEWSTPVSERSAGKLLKIACHGDFDLGNLSHSLSCAAVSA
jgi:hypothetical protein